MTVGPAMTSSSGSSTAITSLGESIPPSTFSPKNRASSWPDFRRGSIAPMVHGRRKKTPESLRSDREAKGKFPSPAIRCLSV